MKKRNEADYREMSLEEVINWVHKNCLLDDIRKRLKSRSVAFILSCHLKEAVAYIAHLEAELKELKGDK